MEDNSRRRPDPPDRYPLEDEKDKVLRQPRPASERDEDEGRGPDDRRRRRPRRDRDEEALEPLPRRRKQRPLSQQALDSRVKLALLGGVVGLVLLGVVLWQVVRFVRQSPFRKALASYLAQPTKSAGTGDSRMALPKMVVVDVGAGEIADLHFDLPDDLRATGPAEVGTIVQLRWNQIQVGTYTSGGGAYKWQCQVTVIDKATQTAIGSATFDGSDPPQTARSQRGRSHYGDKPKEQVVSYLERFPRR